MTAKVKVVVLGASGGCGAKLVTGAVARKHEVTAVVRASSTVRLPDGVRLLRGELTSAAFLRTAVHGQDAVLSALGLRLPGIALWHRPEQADFLDKSTAALIEALRAEGVRRVLAISAGGVGDSYGTMPAAFKAFLAMSALRHVYPALERMEREYFRSGLDVCICRPTGLTDEPATHRAVVPTGLTGRATIPRADVAEWMLDELEKSAFTGRAPLLTVTGAA